MKRFATLSLIAAAVLATGCTRIETGEVGVRVGFDKQVKPGELGRGIKTNKAVREYVENIKESGKVKPVEITSDGFIVDGEHRYSAMVKMGVDDIPVFVGEQLGASGRLVSPYSGISVDVVVPNETASKPVAAQKPENVSDKPKSRKAEPPPQQELPEGKV